MTMPNVGVLKVRPSGDASGAPLDVYFERAGDLGVSTSDDRMDQVLRRPTAGDFQEALEGVMPAAEAIIARIRSSVVSPSEATLEFGIKLAGSIGIPIIANGEAEAHFVVTLTWERKKGEADGQGG